MGTPWWPGALAAGPETPLALLSGPRLSRVLGPGRGAHPGRHLHLGARGPRCRGSANDSTSSSTAAAGVQPGPRHALRADGEAHPEVPAVHPPASGTTRDAAATCLQGAHLLGGGSSVICSPCICCGLWAGPLPSPARLAPPTSHQIGMLSGWWWVSPGFWKGMKACGTQNLWALGREEMLRQ